MGDDDNAHNVLCRAHNLPTMNLEMLIIFSNINHLE